MASVSPLTQESEGEDAEASRVTLAQDLGHGNTAGRTSRVRLHEVGPRLELEVGAVGCANVEPGAWS